MTAIGIDFGSTRCQLAYQPAGRSGAQKLSAVSSWEGLGSKEDTFPYLVIKSTLQPASAVTKLFRYLQREAESKLNQPVSACMVSVPAHSSMLYRDQLLKAVSDAGFGTVKLISEPAALAFSQVGHFPDRSPVLMYLLGASALTISVYQMEAGILKEVASKRSETISGSALTNLFAVNLIKCCMDRHVDETSINHWRAEAERLKITLTTAGEAQVSADFLAMTARKNIPALSLQRRDFETAARPLFQKSLDLCDELLRTAKLRVNDLGDLWLQGRSQSIPLLSHMLADWFGRGPVLIDEYAIAAGCARQAAVFTAAVVESESADLPPVPGKAMIAEVNDPQQFSSPARDSDLKISSIWLESERCLATGDFERALKSLEAADMLLRKQRGNILYQQGLEFEQKGTLPGAEFSLLEQASASLKRAVDMDQDRQEYKQARQRVDDLIKHQHAREKYQQGRKFLDQKKWYEAIQNFRAAVDDDPTQAKYRHDLAAAIIYQAESKLAEVHKEWNQKGRKESTSKKIADIDQLLREARKIGAESGFQNIVEGAAIIHKALRNINPAK
jgi:tetratricopeptide (TPR) repeat protein